MNPADASPPAPVRLHPEVADALRHGQPVVALETAVLTHGLPREPRPGPEGLAGWNATCAANLSLSLLLDATVRAGGATPATVGMLDGVLLVGMTTAELERLRSEEHTSELQSHRS
jgi:pseudouridine-5'-phosphate glycosidase